MYIGGSALRLTFARRNTAVRNVTPPRRTGLVNVGRPHKSIVFCRGFRGQGLNNSPPTPTFLVVIYTSVYCIFRIVFFVTIADNTSYGLPSKKLNTYWQLRVYGRTLQTACLRYGFSKFDSSFYWKPPAERLLLPKNIFNKNNKRSERSASIPLPITGTQRLFLLKVSKKALSSQKRVE